MAAFIKIIATLLSVIITFLSSVTGMWTEQIKSIRTIQKIADYAYTMDYTYEYDIDSLLQNGNSSTVQLVLHGLTSAITNSPENILHPPKGGCTTFNAINSDGDYIMGRNFDYMDSPSAVVWTHPENGYASISTVSLYFFGYTLNFVPENDLLDILMNLAPYAPLDGINEKGLSVAILELEKLPTFQISGKKSLTTTAMVRAVLDKAATLNEAIEIFKTYDMRDFLLGECTYHYQISDANGNSAVIEYVNNKMNIIYPEKKTGNKADFICAANYFLTEGVDDPDGMGQERAEIVNSKLTETKGILGDSEAMNLLQKVSMKDADLHGYICSTLWSAVFNSKNLTADYCFNNDYENVYHFSLDEPQKIK